MAKYDIKFSIEHRAIVVADGEYEARRTLIDAMERMMEDVDPSIYDSDVKRFKPQAARFVILDSDPIPSKYHITYVLRFNTTVEAENEDDAREMIENDYGSFNNSVYDNDEVEIEDVGCIDCDD